MTKPKPGHPEAVARAVHLTWTWVRETTEAQRPQWQNDFIALREEYQRVVKLCTLLDKRKRERRKPEEETP